MIDSQEQVGGWPLLKSKTAPTDTVADAMPDDWERAHGLDPANPADRNAVIGTATGIRIRRSIRTASSGVRPLGAGQVMGSGEEGFGIGIWDSGDGKCRSQTAINAGQ